MVSEIVLKEKMVEYCRKASVLAVEGQRSKATHQKLDRSFVTNVDLRLSELAFTIFEDLIGRSHIVSEEHLENMSRLMNSDNAGSGFGNDDEYTVIVDPIDGTRNYVHNMPLYGVSIGILRNRYPWLGAVAFPALDELLYTDGTEVFLAKALTDSQDTVLTSPEPSLEQTDTILLGDTTRMMLPDFSLCNCMTMDCATLELCWPLIGRGCAAIIGGCIWDFAGAWPMSQLLGFEFRGLRRGKKLVRFDSEDYDPDDYTVKDRLIMARPDHCARISEHIAGALKGEGT